MKKNILTLLFACVVFSVKAQKSFNDFHEYYPIGEDANLGYKTSVLSSEKLVFEANPNVRYSFFNNMEKGLMEKPLKKNVFAAYVAFRSQLRMYDSESLPVIMPSYRVQLGGQMMRRLNDNNFIAISLESGHYSNGQSGSAFSEALVDGSPESEALYNKITPETNLSAILNRRSANFSTNLTELLINYRNNKNSSENLPSRTHSVTGGLLLYHNRFLGVGNFGGFTENDIRIYGRYRWQLRYEFIKQLKNVRASVAERMELIQGAHPFVDPFRSETILTIYPFPKTKAFGFFANYTFGHDNYNYRFVDSGRTLSFGITWTIFPPFQMNVDE